MQSGAEWLPPVLLIDLDDTIVDDAGGSDTVERLWRAACLEAARTRGLDAEALYQAIDIYRTWYWNDPERHRVGRTDLRAASAHIVEQSLRKLGIVDQSFARRISDDYRDRREAALCLFPGALDTLEAFVASGTRLALVTNGIAADQRSKIACFDLEQYFEHIQIEGEFGLGKPAPEVYLHVLAKLGTAAADAWMVGDNLEWDVAAPQRLGIRGIWVDVAGSGLPPGLRSLPRPGHNRPVSVAVPRSRPLSFGFLITRPLWALRRALPSAPAPNSALQDPAPESSQGTAAG